MSNETPSPAEWRAMSNQVLTQVVEGIKEVKVLIKEQNEKTESKFTHLEKQIADVREKVIKIEATNHKETIDGLREATEKLSEKIHGKDGVIEKLQGERGVYDRLTKIETKSLIAYAAGSTIITLILNLTLTILLKFFSG